jgi:peroxiredoxin
VDFDSFASTPASQPRLSSHVLLSALALSLAFLLCPAAQAQDDTPHSGSDVPPILKIGSQAPDFNLPGVDGKSHSLNDYASSKVLVVIFSCNHCPVAQMYEKRIKQLYTDYKDRGVAVVVIMGNDPKAEELSEYGYTDVADSFADMKARAAYRNLPYPYLYDGDTQAVALKYGPTATPHAFIFDQQRILRYEGRIDSNQREELAKKHEARDAIDALLAGKTVAVTDTPAVGCSTKWAYKSANVEKNVWATWCGPCVKEFPELETMVRMYGNRPINIVTLSINNPDEKPMVSAFLQKQHAFNKNYLFNSDDAADAVKAFGTDWKGGAPYTVLIGTKGEILYKTQGEMNPLEVRRAILKNVADDLYLGQHAYWNSTF